MTTTDVLTVPFLDLGAVNEPLRDDFERAWRAVLGHGRFVGGAEVDRFEDEFAAFCGASSCVGVANGTDALELILLGLGIGRGDEVIVPANTFVATAEAVCAAGARPVFVDVLPDTLQIDPAAVAAAVTPATAAVMAVHLFGQMADVDALAAVAGRHGIALVEDAAQAHGARFAGRRAGSVGIAGGLQLLSGQEPRSARRRRGGGHLGRRRSPRGCAALSNHGRAADDRHRHDARGRNSRLDTLQAAVLSAKLPWLDEHNAGRAAAMDALPHGPSGRVPAAVGPSRRPPRAPPGGRGGRRPAAGHERTERERDRMGDPLPGPVPPPARLRPSRRRAPAGRGAGGGADPLAADVAIDHRRRGVEGLRGPVGGRRVSRPHQGDRGAPGPEDTIPRVADVRDEETREGSGGWAHRLPPRRLSTDEILRLCLLAGLIVVVGAAIGFVSSWLIQAQYGARSEILYTLREDQPTGFLREDRNLTTQVVLIDSRPVLEPVAVANGLTVDQLADKVTASVAEGSEIIEIEVRDADRREGLRLVNAVTRQYLAVANGTADENRSYLEDQLESIEAQLSAPGTTAGSTRGAELPQERTS